MSISARFAAYAEAFEQSYASDDWSLVEPFFTEDATYEIGLPSPLGGTIAGRPAILEYFKQALDRFDRRFESRELAITDGPHESDDRIRFRGTATYRAAGVPEIVLELEETAIFEGDRICRLEDRYEPAMVEQLMSYMAEHGAKLGLSAPDA